MPQQQVQIVRRPIACEEIQILSKSQQSKSSISIGAKTDRAAVEDDAECKCGQLVAKIERTQTQILKPSFSYIQEKKPKIIIKQAKSRAK